MVVGVVARAPARHASALPPACMAVVRRPQHTEVLGYCQITRVCLAIETFANSPSVQAIVRRVLYVWEASAGRHRV